MSWLYHLECTPKKSENTISGLTILQNCQEKLKNSEEQI